MADYTPTNDVFGRFIEGLKLGMEMKDRKAKEQALATSALQDKEKADLASLRFGAELSRASGGVINSVAEYKQALEGYKNIATEAQRRPLGEIIGLGQVPLPTPLDYDPNAPTKSIGSVPVRTDITPKQESPQQYSQPGVSEEQIQKALPSISGANQPMLEQWKTGLENISQAYSPVEIDPNTGATVQKYSPSFGKSAIRPISKPAESTGTGGARAGGGAPLTKEGLETAARIFIQTGQVPNVGMGAAANRVQIINRAGEILRNKATGKVDISSIIVNTAKTKANTSSYAQLQKQADNIGAFERTALANADVALSMAGQVDRTGVPVLNKWINAGRRGITGNPELIGFDTAVRTFVNEYARITTSVTGGGVTSDTARKEVEDLLKAAHTPEQFMASLNVAKQDMQNRVKSYTDQFSAMDKRIEAQVNPVTTPKSDAWTDFDPNKDYTKP